MASAKPLLFATGIKLETPPVPLENRRAAGYLLRQVQLGDDPDPTMCANFKAYTQLGSGCYQISLDKTWRIIYWAGASAIYVLHVFQKKSNSTPKLIKQTCESRLKTCKEHHRSNYEK